MNRLTLTKDPSMDATIVSNYFIDDYMIQANEAQIKIYLYLLRLLSAGISTSIPEICDIFNYMEADVVRGINYWAQKGLLEVSLDSSEKITGIRFIKPADMDEKKQGQLILFNTSTQQTTSPSLVKKQSPKTEAEDALTKPSYSPNDLLQMKKTDEKFSELIFVAESYLGRTLKHSDCESLAYIYRDLKLPTELIDYLIEYCVGRGKKQMRYIESVAINWSNDQITTVRQAKMRASKYDKAVYTIMHALGRTDMPTEAETAYIYRWYKEYAFHMEVILEAIKKTVLATESNRFQYAEGILKRWHNAGIHTLDAIAKEEAQFQKEKAAKALAKKTPANSFNSIQKRDYDFAELERTLRSN